MKKEFQPTKLLRLNCDKCGELLAKFYPNHTFNLPPENSKYICKKCLYKQSSLKNK